MLMETVRNFIYVAQKYAKAIVAGAGSLLVAIVGLSESLGIEVLSEGAKEGTLFVLAVLTAFSTWAVPNKETGDFIDGE